MNSATTESISSKFENLLEQVNVFEENFLKIRGEVDHILGRNYHYDNLSHNSSDTAQTTQEANDWLVSKVNSQNPIEWEKMQKIFHLIGLVTDYFDFWRLFRDLESSINTQLIELAKKILISTTSKTEYHFVTDYHQAEKLERLNKITLENNFPALYNEYHRFHEEFTHYFEPSIKNAFCILFFFDKDGLSKILESKSDIPFLWGVMNMIGKMEAMKIAIKTKNQKLKFAAIASVLPFNSMNDTLLKSEKKMLIAVFSDLMKDNDLWQSWMTILNRYPSRYSHIQTSLGEALAKTGSKSALLIYYQAIDLNNARSVYRCREVVGHCLDVFAQFANKEQQKQAWQQAFSVWNPWFIALDKEKISGVESGALDYAIVRYYLVCIGADARLKALEEFYNTVNNINNIWHKSSSHRSGHYYHQLSKFQLIYHAEQINKDSSIPYLSEVLYSPIYEKDYLEFMLGMK